MGRMPEAQSSVRTDPGARTHIVVAVGSGQAARQVVEGGKRLADALDCDWDAVHVETPEGGDSQDPGTVAEALALASRLGATVAKVPGATVADGLVDHLDGSPAQQLVLGNDPHPGSVLHRRLIDRITHRRPDLVLHLVPTSGGTRRRRRGDREHTPFASYGYAAGAVALTLLLALILNRAAGVQFLSFLFLFPVIAAAARWGSRQALAASFLSVVGFNFFFLAPVHALKPVAIQSWVMAAVLAVVGVYTGILTANLRGRTALSERSAQENARLAAFALELTRANDWSGTARIICTEITGLLDVQAVLVREVSGKLKVAASVPPGTQLETLDEAALNWAWSEGVPAGIGSTVMAAANWQFHPLKTSLGTLAVLGLAREDGTDPVPAEKKVLLSTLAAQAALSLERLRLEDQMRSGNV